MYVTRKEGGLKREDGCAVASLLVWALFVFMKREKRPKSKKKRGLHGLGPAYNKVGLRASPMVCHLHLLSLFIWQKLQI